MGAVVVVVLLLLRLPAPPSSWLGSRMEVVQCADFVSATAVTEGRTSHSLNTTQGGVGLFRPDDGWKSFRVGNNKAEGSPTLQTNLELLMS